MMVALKDKIQGAMDEVRTLVLGTQVLLGCQYQSILEPQFAKLSLLNQLPALAAIGLLLVNFVVLLIPASHHLIVYRGRDEEGELQLTNRCAAVAPGFFALALAIGLYLSFLTTLGVGIAVPAAAAGAVMALLCWYVPWKRRRGVQHAGKMENEMASLHDRIRQVLTETRVVLPGAQALLGFDYVSTLMDGFAQLPAIAKLIHLLSLSAVTIAIILLMTPAAYHRIVEQGRDSERFLKLAGGLLITAMVPLAVGLSGEVFVVVLKVTDSEVGSLMATTAAAVLFAVAWFVVPLLLRGRKFSPPARSA